MPIFPKIEVINVTLGYNDHPNIIEGLTFTINGPGIIRIEGPNGCGKSTLLEAIAGHLQLREGSIRVCDQESTQGRNKHVSFIRTIPAFAHSVTMRDHCLLFAGTSNSGIERISQIIDALSLQKFLDHTPSQLSSGTRRKFWVALGLLRETPILIVDEPFNELDEISSQWLYRKFISEASKRLIILVCHAWPAEYPKGKKEHLLNNLTITRYLSAGVSHES